MTFRNLCFTMDHALQTRLLNQPTGIIPRRVFEDRACALLYRLRPLAMLFIFLNNLPQLLRIFVVKTYCQQQNNLGWFNQSTRDWLRIALLIKHDTAQFAKTAVTIT